MPRPHVKPRTDPGYPDVRDVKDVPDIPKILDLADVPVSASPTDRAREGSLMPRTRAGPG